MFMKTQRTDTSEALPQPLSDEAWKSVLPFLKAFPNIYVGNPETCRRFLSAVVWMTKEGASWRAWFRKSMDIGTRSIAGSVDGAMRVSLRHFMNIFTMPVNSPLCLLTRRSCAHIPAQRVLRKKRRTRRSRSRTHPRRIHHETSSVPSAMTGFPLRWILTSGNRNDITQASALIEGSSYEYVIGDKAYDADAFREAIISAGGVAVIPPRDSRKDPRPYDEDLYKRRNIIERFFHRLKQYRRVATRYDKLATRYLGFVYFATILINTHRM